MSSLVRELVPNSSGLGPQELKSYSRFGGMRRHIAWNVRWPIYGHADDPLETLKELDYFRTHYSWIMFAPNQPQYAPKDAAMICNAPPLLNLVEL